MQQITDIISKNVITAIYMPNPFKTQDRTIKSFVEPKMMSDMVAEFEVPAPEQFLFILNGHEVKELDTTQLRPGDFVVVCPQVRGGGGGGKNIAGLIAGIALMVFSGGAAAGLAGVLGSTSGTLGLGLALYFGGSLLMGNQKIPKIDTPNMSGSAFEGGYGWRPDTVSVRPGGPIPLTYGTVKTSGQLINRRIYSKKIGSSTGDEKVQFLYLLLAAGEGELSSITNIEINGTPINLVANAEYSYRRGTNDQNAATTVLSNLVEQDAFNTELPTTLSGADWATRTTTSYGKRIDLEFCYPAGSYRIAGDTGANVPISTMYRVQYREAGTPTWYNVETDEGQIYRSRLLNTRKPYYFTTSIPADPTKLYEFRAQNYTLTHYGTTHGWVEMPATWAAQINWLAVTVLDNDAETYPNTALVVLGIPASENLSGGMPRVSWKQTRSTIWAFNPETNTYQSKDATNLAWMVYDLIHQCKYLRNRNTWGFEYTVFGAPAKNLNYAAFAEWADWCAETVGGVPRAKGNMLVDAAAQLWPTVQRIAGSARGYIIEEAGVFRPVWDKVTPMTQIFTSGNILAGSIRGGFLPERERATAIEASFINEDNGYDRDTVFIPGDDYNPASLENPTQITIPALTNPKAIYMLARHMLKKNKFLKRKVSFQADIDSIVSQIGDVVGVQSDITRWGVGGRIMGATTTQVIIDQDVILMPGQTYSIMVRGSDDTLTRKVVDAVAETITTNTLNFVGAPFTTAPARFDNYAFGQNELETKPFQIISIRRNGELQATIDAIEYIEGVFTDDDSFPVINYTDATAGISSLTINADADEGRLAISWSVPENGDYYGAIVFVDGKPMGFLTAEVSNFVVDEVPGGHTVTVVPVGGRGNGDPVTQEVTLGEPTLIPVSGITLASELVEQGDGTNLIYITGSMTIPAMAQTVLVEIGEGSTPTSWSTVQDSRAAVLRYGPVKPSQTYSLRFTARNKYATADTITELVSTAGDAIAPNAPSISATSYLKSVTVAISLAVVPSDLAGFKIYRHTANSSGAATEVGSVASRDGRAKYKEEAPEYGVTYYYWVKSFDTWGNLSPFSAVNSTLIVSIEGSDIVDGALNRSELFQAGVVDATAIGNAAVEEAKIAVGAVNTAQINNAALKLPEGPVARWTAKGSTTASIAVVGGVKDVSGNSNHGRAFGGVAVVDSEVGKAFSFDGSDDYIDTPVNLFSGTSSANPASLSLFIKHDSTQASSNGYSVIFGQAYYSGFGLSVYYGRLRAFFRNSVSLWASSIIGVQDAWQHIVLVWGGQSDPKVYIYLNGTLIQLLSINYADFGRNLNSFPLRIAYPYHGGGDEFTNLKGQIAHPRIYDRALTAAEVKTLYMMTEDATFGTITADLLTTGELITKTAQIADAIIDDAKIANLDAGKIKTGFLAAARIEAGSITTAKLAAGAVTAEKLLIGKAGSALNPDPNFEDVSAWEATTGTAKFETITFGVVGNHVIGNIPGTRLIARTVNMIPIDANKQYRLKIRVYGTTGQGWRAGIYYYNSALTLIATHVKIITGFLYQAWRDEAAIDTPPSGAAFARIFIDLNYDNGATALQHYAQDFRLEEVLPATLIQDGAIVTDKLAVNAVTAGKIESDAIEARHMTANSVEADSIKAGAVEADKIATGAITAEKINVTALKAPAGAVASWSAKGSTTASIAVVGGVKDVSGNGNHGRAYGGVEVVDSEVGKAFSFASSGRYIDTGLSSSQFNSAFTMSAWLLPSATGTRNTIFTDSATWENFALYARHTAGADILTAVTIAGQRYDLSAGTVNYGQLNHISVTFENLTFNIYINGLLVGEGANATARTANHGTIRAGYAGISDGGFGVAHPRIYDRALTAAEVKTLYMLGTDTESGTITADRVVTGELKSLNYSTTAGSMLDLDNGNFTVGGSANPVFTLNAAAKTGSIAGFTMSETDLTAGVTTSAIGISMDASKMAFWAGSTTPTSAPFRVTQGGKFVASEGGIGRFVFDIISSEGFSFTRLGYLDTAPSTTKGTFTVWNSMDPGYTNQNYAYTQYLQTAISSTGKTHMPGGLYVGVRFSDQKMTAQFTNHLGVSDHTDDGKIPLVVNIPSSANYALKTNAKIYAAGGFYPASDRRVKSNIRDTSVLDQLKRVEIKKYTLDHSKMADVQAEAEIERNLRDNNAVCHGEKILKDGSCESIGVMADSFNSAFGLSDSTETYNLTDAIGVALRAIQELSAIVDAQKATIKDLCEKLHIAEPDYPVEPEYYLTREEQELIDLADKQTPEQHEHFLKVMEDIEKWERKQK